MEFYCFTLILHYKRILPFKCTVELDSHERTNVLTEAYNVVVNSEELTGATEHLTQ